MGLMWHQAPHLHPFHERKLRQNTKYLQKQSQNIKRMASIMEFNSKQHLAMM
jgi:hypothetical protein